MVLMKKIESNNSGVIAVRLHIDLILATRVGLNLMLANLDHGHLLLRHQLLLSRNVCGIVDLLLKII